MIRRRNVGPSFTDLLFIICFGFILLVFIMVPFLNPPAKTGDVETPNVMIVELEWSDESNRDIDLHVRGPDGVRVYYANKTSGYFTLERDDLGTTSDTYTINGERVVVRRNYEIISFSQLPQGEYVINVHYFSGQGESEAVKVRVTTITPFRVVFEGEININPLDERTMVTFIINQQGKVEDIRTDIQIPLRNKRRAP